MSNPLPACTLRLLALLAGVTLLAPWAGSSADAARGEKDTPDAAQVAAQQEDIDRVVVAAVLIGDGHCDRALRVLDEVDLDNAAEEFDAARYWRLKGVCHFQLGAQAQAVSDFQKALDAGETSTEVVLRLAQAHAALSEHEEALAVLDKAPPEAYDQAGAYMLEARSLNALERYEEAWNTLQAGRERFPDDISFERETLYLLIELGLYQEAREVGARYLDKVDDDPVAWFAVGEALRRTGNYDEALGILEAARIRFPDEKDAYTILARTYVDMGLNGACGSVLQQAAELDPILAAAAADCFRDAGRMERAFYLNTLVPDAEMKAKQRLDLSVRAQEWGQAIALIPRLETLGLLDEDPVAYAAAYALFQAGRYDQAESMLKRIEDAQLFKDAAALRKAMADCRANPENCL